MPDWESKFVQIDDLSNFVTISSPKILLREDVDRAALDHDPIDLVIIESLVDDLQLSDVIFFSFPVDRIGCIYEDAHGVRRELQAFECTFSCPSKWKKERFFGGNHIDYNLPIYTSNINRILWGTAFT